MHEVISSTLIVSTNKNPEYPYLVRNSGFFLFWRQKEKTQVLSQKICGKRWFCINWSDLLCVGENLLTSRIWGRIWLGRDSAVMPPRAFRGLQKVNRGDHRRRRSFSYRARLWASRTYLRVVQICLPPIYLNRLFFEIFAMIYWLSCETVL